MIRRLTALATCLVLVAVPLGGCGKKAPGIPRSDASELIALLKNARQESDNPQRCVALLGTIRDLEAKIAGLPSNVDGDVRSSLANGVKNLAASAQSQCSKTQTTPTTPTTPTATQTTPSIPTTPHTTPTAPHTTPSTPSTSTTPSTPSTSTTPGNGTGGTGPGSGNGNGGGGGGG